MAKCRPILLPLVAIWQQDFARRKPLFLLAANFRCADDRLSNGKNDPAANAIGPAANLDHRSTAIPHPIVSPMKKAPLSRWEHRYLGQELFPETLSALEI